jgi:hypothetical protein
MLIANRFMTTPDTASATLRDRLATDLAGYCPPSPSYLQIRARINTLIDRYLTLDSLSHHLADLPNQFHAPQTRHWQPIDWKAIDRSQIIGIDPALFVTVLSGAIEIEAPIRGYSQETWQYLQELHPEMAIFIGGTLNEDGSIKTLGVWEKEERQHSPLFRKLYQILTNEVFEVKANSIADYDAINQPWDAIKRHLLGRISTEWGATSVYLWLMAHSTGALQQAIAQPFQDEVNHLAKFWGFSRWAFASSYHDHFHGSALNLVSLVKHHQSERTHGRDFLTHYPGIEELSNSIELAFSLMRVMVRLRRWNGELSSSFLKHLLGPVPALRP